MCTLVNAVLKLQWPVDIVSDMHRRLKILLQIIIEFAMAALYSDY